MSDQPSEEALAFAEECGEAMELSWDDEERVSLAQTFDRHLSALREALEAECEGTAALIDERDTLHRDVERLTMKCNQYREQLEDGWSAILGVMNEETRKRCQDVLATGQREGDDGKGGER